MGKGVGDNHPPHFEKLRVAKLIYPPYFCIKFRTKKTWVVITFCLHPIEKCTKNVFLI
jgi:hypothetical protein